MRLAVAAPAGVPNPLAPRRHGNAIWVSRSLSTCPVSLKTRRVKGWIRSGRALVETIWPEPVPACKAGYSRGSRGSCTQQAVPRPGSSPQSTRRRSASRAAPEAAPTAVRTSPRRSRVVRVGGRWVGGCRGGWQARGPRHPVRVAPTVCRKPTVGPSRPSSSTLTPGPGRAAVGQATGYWAVTARDRIPPARPGPANTWVELLRRTNAGGR